MKDFRKEYINAIAEELEIRFGTRVATEVMKAIRLNSEKRMEDK